MIPLGYLAKHVAKRPAWLRAPDIEDVYSVSGCVSKPFADYVGYWKHNGYWLFDSPAIVRELARDHSVDLVGAQLFFYAAYDRAFDGARWAIYHPEPSLRTEVVVPVESVLEGYDVVTYSSGTGAECSPLSCNGLAAEIETNRHCLLPTLERAQRLLEEGRFSRSEPGPYRVLAVYSTAWPGAGDLPAEPRFART